MTSAPVELQQGALITRDAHEALRSLKSLVDLATESAHAAEMESVSMAVGHTQGEESRRTLLAAAEMLRSPKFESALRRALAKVESAVAWHSVRRRAAHSG